MGFPKNKDKKIEVVKGGRRIGNDFFIFEGGRPIYVRENFYEGWEENYYKKRKIPHNRVGNDIYVYRHNRIYHIENYYQPKLKNKKKREISDSQMQKMACAVILIVAFIVPLFFPLFKFTSNSVNFYITGTKNEFRAEYPISFNWEISSSISQAVIVWGDGTTNDINKTTSGSLEHAYDLQGIYSPTLLVWDFFGKLHSKPIEIKIQNDMLHLNIEVKEVVIEGQEVEISVENIFELNPDLSKNEKGLKFVYDLSETQIISNESSITYRWKNDGTFPLTVSVMDSQGVISRQSRYITVINEPPNAKFTTTSNNPYLARSNLKFNAEESSDTINDEDSLQFLWNWGDDTTSWGKYVSHSYHNPGVYNVSLYVIDDDGVCDLYSQLITIDESVSSELPVYNSTCNEPYIAIGTFLNEMFEGEEIQFTSEINRNITNFSVLWSFGDGTYSTEPHPIHAWSNAGIYNLVLQVVDIEGQSHTRTKSITVMEKAPEILGPYNFQGIEGQAITLDVEVYDSILDIPHIIYQWYDHENRLISTEKTPTFMLDVGEHNYTLKVSDNSGMTSSQPIKIIIHPISHELFVASYMYHGVPGNALELRAYLYDTFNNATEYEFFWTITHGYPVLETSQKLTQNFHQISFPCTETAVYQGEVKVVDSFGNTKVSIFEIYSFIDSSLNGINDEYENMLRLSTASPTEDTEDSDGDNLPDNYEVEISKTNPYNPDTDEDGLYDGYDASGIGELTLNTDPCNFDSDYDSLRDGTEYYGFNISINYFENRSTFHINSDPLSSDTDNDGVSDYEEYISGTNPRLIDSDCDKLPDLDDPFPATWDQDNDLLSDFMELKLGTDINVSDSDLDGINDGSEIYGWGILNYKTNPLYSDTDGDFLDDYAEILNYNYGLEDEYGTTIRVNLTQPVSLHFPERFKKATIGQISFAITYGEYGEDSIHSYGIQDQTIQNLNVIISKSDDNIVLYNSNTNSTRYFSYVVDITDIMNNNSLNYYGDYTIEVKDLNNPSQEPKCLLEQFELQVSRYLNPNDEDTDNDGIFDGVEMGFLVEGMDVIDIHDFYNSTIANENENTGINEFSLEIPQTGRVYAGNLVIEIESQDILLGSGNVSFQVLKQNVNNSIKNVVILDDFKFFSENEQFWYYKAINLSQIVDDGLISEYCGNYFLRINAQDTNTNDTFIVSEYYITTETYVQAGPTDSHAWHTDPFLEDSDEDGWSDYYEIFTSGTNPLSKDTDGDSAWDPNDRNPFRDVMIEISPISASVYIEFWPFPPPELELVIQLNVNDLVDPQFSEKTSMIGFCTTSQTTTLSNGYYEAWWTEGEGHHYYFDISDDKTIQSNLIPFSFQLWLMMSTGDLDLFGSWIMDTYLIRKVGNKDLLTVEITAPDGSKLADICYEIAPIAIERANTIAIYNPNATTFTAHYNENERMNIIQLHVRTEGHYPASVSFENEQEGSKPHQWTDEDGWIDIGDHNLCPTIIDEVDGHRKVLQFYDDSGSGMGSVIHLWRGNYLKGTIEVWLRMSSSSHIADFIICDRNEVNSIYFRFDANGYMRYKVGTNFYYLDPYQPNTWIHLKFEWDCNDDWHLWINGESRDYGYGFAFQGNPIGGMDNLLIRTHDLSAGYNFYADAIGYSFDQEYTIGDNREEATCEGTPFEIGPNTIVIPTSLFDKTLLNSYIQNEQLDETPLYSTQEGLFELYSIDREGTIVDEQCGDCDFVFIRYEITPEDAMKVLNSLLMYATNQSTDEDGNTITTFEKTFDYVSTKLNGTMAVTMNLPHGILSFIPWIADLKSSSFGDPPQSAQFNFLSLLDFFLFFILLLVSPIIALISIIVIGVIFFASLFTKVAANLGLAALSFLSNLLWIIIRTALLVMFYILLAIELLTISLMILPIGIALMALSGLMGISTNWGISCCVSYGINTRVGHLRIEMNEMSVCIETWINWIYWEFFDLYIPLPDMEYSMNTTIDEPSVTPEPPSLNCGYEQIGGIDSTIFDFYTVYQDVNGDPPNYVLLWLIAPDGSKTPLYMSERSDYDEDYIHLTGIEYNVTIDFANKDPGQWFYYFITEENSTLDSIARWPIDYYCEPGPYISTNHEPEDFYKYFLLSDVDRYSGAINQEFEFMVVGADFLQNKIPTNVFLNLIYLDGEMQSLSMNPEESYTIEIGEDSTLRNVTFSTYRKNLNFSEYIDIDDLYIVRSYYTAEFSDGDSSILFDYYEDKFYNHEFNLTAKKWFNKPTLIPSSIAGPPTIVGWRVEEVSNSFIADSTDNSGVPIGPIVDEQILRFWVFISDPDGDHLYHMNEYGFVFKPKLFLKNCDSTNPIEPIEMVWAGQDYDPYPECDAYFIDVLPLGAYTYNYENVTECNFGPGAWTFSFSIADQSGNVVNQLASIGGHPKKIWLIGSINQMWYTALNGYDFSGDYIDKIIPGAGVVASIGISVSFFATAVLSMTGKTGQLAARYISMGILAYDIVNSFIGLGVLLSSEDTGTLLGMGLGALISAAGGALAHFIGSLNLGNWNGMWKFSKYIFLVNIIISMICNPTILINTKTIGFMILPGSGDEFDWDLPNEEEIRKIPGVLSQFLISVLSLGSILNIASRACVGSIGNNLLVSNPVLKTVKYYTLLKTVISVLCIISFFIKTGMHHVIGDYYSNPVIMFGG